jgi:hypothetical protein
MESPKGQPLEKPLITTTKRSAGNGYLLSIEELSAKYAHIGSNSTASTCSDLDISCRTASAVSSSESNVSEYQTVESPCSTFLASPRSEMLTTMPVGASPIDQTIVVAPAAPVSNARSFCQKAFAECNLDNLDDELADLTKDLEALRSDMASSKRVLCA